MVICDQLIFLFLVKYLASIPNMMWLAHTGTLNIILIHASQIIDLGENGLFLGQHHSAFDHNDRLPVPSRFNELLSDGGVLIQGFDRNLWILPAAKFQLLCQRVSTMSITDPKARLLLRLLLGQACELDADGSGGILIPQNLREFAELGKQTVIVGQGDYFEIWDTTLWQKQETQLGDADANSERFASLAISLS